MMRYAFFDVDETLIKFKSMFAFYRFWLIHNHGMHEGSRKYLSFFKKITELKQNHDRSVVNKFYYQIYAGIKEDDLKLVAEFWWKKLLSNKSIFHEIILERFLYHKKSGLKTILVSGSMSYCLDPLIKYLDADYGICTNLEVENGVLSGKLISEPNIGEGKVKSIKRFLSEQNGVADLNNSFAYGDHESDMPMLNLTGNSYLLRNGTLQQINSSQYDNKN